MTRKRALSPVQFVDKLLAGVPVHLMNPKDGRAACGVRVRKGPYRSSRSLAHVTCGRCKRLVASLTNIKTAFTTVSRRRAAATRTKGTKR